MKTHKQTTGRASTIPGQVTEDTVLMRMHSTAWYTPETKPELLACRRLASRGVSLESDDRGRFILLHRGNLHLSLARERIARRSKRLARADVDRWHAPQVLPLPSGEGGPGADHRLANLAGMYLERTDLSRADFRRAFLQQTYFRGANLTGARFGGADLTCANLYGALLSGADFTGAILSGADFTGAILSGADFTSAIRGPNDPAIPGWYRRDSAGRLSRLVDTRSAVIISSAPDSHLEAR